MTQTHCRRRACSVPVDPHPLTYLSLPLHLFSFLRIVLASISAALSCGATRSASSRSLRKIQASHEVRKAASCHDLLVCRKAVHLCIRRTHVHGRCGASQSISHLAFSDRFLYLRLSLHVLIWSGPSPSEWMSALTPHDHHYLMELGN